MATQDYNPPTRTLQHFASFIAKHYQISEGVYPSEPLGDFVHDFVWDMCLRPEVAVCEASLANILGALPYDMHEYARTCWAAYCE